MKVRVVKSAEAPVKIPHIVTITSGTAAQGFVTNIEGILNRVKHQVEFARTQKKTRKKRKVQNMLKKY